MQKICFVNKSSETPPSIKILNRIVVYVLHKCSPWVNVNEVWSSEVVIYIISLIIVKIAFTFYLVDSTSL